MMKMMKMIYEHIYILKKMISNKDEYLQTIFREEPFAGQSTRQLQK